MTPAPRTVPVPPPLPLERYSLFKSTEVDEARDFVARVFCETARRCGAVA